MQPLMIISIWMFAFSAIAFIVAITLFFRLRIKEVYLELTGKTATAEIARIREQGIVRQSKGRSLLSVIGETTDNNSFDLDKIGFAGSPEPMTELLGSEVGGESKHEPMTELLEP